VGEPNSGWIHCSICDKDPRKQFLHAYRSEGKTKYKPIIGKATMRKKLLNFSSKFCNMLALLSVCKVSFDVLIGQPLAPAELGQS
ncbi:MAG: hypothetical protein ACPH5N_00510, partial [Pseudomonadales bacterium]